MRKTYKHILALTVILITFILVGIYASINEAYADQHPLYPPGVMNIIVSANMCLYIFFIEFLNRRF